MIINKHAWIYVNKLVQYIYLFMSQSVKNDTEQEKCDVSGRVSTTAINVLSQDQGHSNIKGNSKNEKDGQSYYAK